MFFGGRDAEKVEADRLDALLNSLFTKKISSLDSRASGIARDLTQTKVQFIDACRTFADLDAEPDTEDMFVANVNAIKTQKNVYAKALANVINGLSVDDEGSPNAYVRYNGLLANVEGTINEMLKLNANYKQVVYRYSNHIGAFKKLFSNMEKLRDTLRIEIENKSKEFLEYNKLNDEILGLHTLIEEARALDRAIAEINENSARREEGNLGVSNEQDISGKLSGKRAELVALSNEIIRARGRIDALAAPLERPARKFDHGSARKRQLHVLLEDPYGSIKDESDYQEFVSLAQELKSSLDAGRIDVKNQEDTGNAVAALLNSNVFSMLASVRSLEARRYAMNDEIKLLERALEDIMQSRLSSERSLKEVEDLQKRAGGVVSAKELRKSSIEKLFQSYYGRRISILI
ncbi:MAG: hypothetical protein KGH72_04755 [Candidatus Micrarchaeota archaeon]|nr:hypothetical protein [Candidatus Micrarchaeota archaeon]